MGIAKGRKFLRIDTTDFAGIAPRVREIEAIVNAVLASDDVAIGFAQLASKDATRL